MTKQFLQSMAHASDVKAAQNVILAFCTRFGQVRNSSVVELKYKPYTAFFVELDTPAKTQALIKTLGALRFGDSAAFIIGRPTPAI